MIRVNESSDHKKIIIIKLNDFDDQLIEFLNKLKKIASGGHSFPIVIDPDNPDYREEFYIDGDGSFRIEDIKVGDA